MEPRCVGNYVILNRLGGGSFGTVYRGQHRKTNQVVAVKQVLRGKDVPKQESLSTEISILKQLPHHPNVMRLHDTVSVTNDALYLMLEYCPGGDLAQVVHKQGSQPEPLVRRALRQLTRGLHVLHSHGIIHRDLKPQNLLLSSAWPHGTLKIGDFGFARQLAQQDLAATTCGSPLYMAPEVLRGDSYDATADVWSVGVIAFELLVGSPPHAKAASSYQILQMMERQRGPVPVELPCSLSPQCQSFLYSTLQREASRRPKVACLFDEAIFNDTDYSAEDDETCALRHAFERFDTDRSGALDLCELRGALNELGLAATPAETSQVLARYDTDWSGTLDFIEFRQLVEELRRFQRHRTTSRPMHNTTAPKHAQMFQRFDRDSSGDIDVSELREALREFGINMSVGQAVAVMDKFDATRSGRLNLPEFTAMLSQLRCFQAIKGLQNYMAECRTDQIQTARVGHARAC